MQEHPEAIFISSVRGIADDCVAGVCNVHPDLVPTAGERSCAQL